jgi:hypothetical protein
VLAREQSRKSDTDSLFTADLFAKPRCDVSNCAVTPYSKCCKGLQLVARILSLDSSDDEYRLAGAVDCKAGEVS